LIESKQIRPFPQRIGAAYPTPSLKQALKKEQEQIAAQAALSGEISSKFNALAYAKNDEERSTLSSVVSEGMRPQGSTRTYKTGRTASGVRAGI